MMSDKSSGSSTTGTRVLVVDDEQEIRKVFGKALRDAGCSGVETADSARTALQTLMQQSFDVLVVDIRMQEMNGIVFLQEALKIWPWLGVVIVSGYVNADIRAKAKGLGVTRIIEKPVDLQEVCRQVEEEAKGKRHQQTGIPEGNALALMRDHLRLLTRLDSKTIGSETLVGALLEFGKALAGMLPADAVGILVLEGKERALLVAAQTALSREFVDRVEAEMLSRYEALSGEKCTLDSLRVQVEGEAFNLTGPATIGSSLAVPVILGQQVCGLLTLATAESKAYTPTDISLLYHAANHISAVFMALRKMHHLATRDTLTGAFNRIRLEEELERAWLLSRRYGFSMAIVIVDIDHFKTLNDAYGHSVGDEILTAFAQVIDSAARASDIIARYGGDEFVAILSRAAESDARAFGERLLTSTREHVFCDKTHSLNLTASIGIAVSVNEAAPATSAELLSQADRALYTAKRAGRNRICVWPEPASMGAARTEPSIGESATPADAGEPSPISNRVMVVDDEPAILDVLRVMLERQGYEVTTFASATEAVRAIRTEPGAYDVLLTDLGLPDMSGIELLHEVAAIDDLLVKIVVTGRATVDNAVTCLREGAYDFVQKPVIEGQFNALMKRAMEYHQLRKEQIRYQSHLEDMVRKRSSQLASSLEEIRKSYEFTLEALVAMLDARENQTGQHSIRTRELAVTLARRMGLERDEVQAIASGALLHDIGKIGIPDEILLRPGPLTADEWEVMKKHSDIGHRILHSSPYLRQAAKIVLAHHEHYDGSGYPLGLHGDEICVGARIFAVVDAYDSMRSVRVYREAMTAEEALTEVRKNSGTQFDPEVVEPFLECQPEIEKILSAPVES